MKFLTTRFYLISLLLKIIDRGFNRCHGEDSLSTPGEKPFWMEWLVRITYGIIKRVSTGTSSLEWVNICDPNAIIIIIILLKAIWFNWYSNSTALGGYYILVVGLVPCPCSVMLLVLWCNWIHSVWVICCSLVTYISCCQDQWKEKLDIFKGLDT